MPTSDIALSLGDALARHYRAHGLPLDGGEHDRTFRVRLGRVTLRLPNPPSRRRAVFFHDVNHVLTGYDTSFAGGEMEIAAFEISSGCGSFWMAWGINLTMFALGLLTAPRRAYAAFVRGRHVASVYRRREDRAMLSAMTVAGLMALMKIDQAPSAATTQDRVWFVGWAVVALLVLVLPVLVAVAGVRAIVGVLAAA
jgi:hypothetical protein